MDTKFSNMKKLFILCAILFSTNILNAQTIQELEGRYTPPTSNKGGSGKKGGSGEKGGSGKKGGSRWDDFVDAFTPEDQTWGLGYSYSQTFPLSLSLNLTSSCFSLATEFGFNLDGKKYSTKYNLDDKKYITKEYNPSGYWVISPGFYCRFLSINCGVGFITSNYSETHIVNFAGESEDGSIIVDGSISLTTTGNRTAKFNFMLKPSITGYIPICGEDYYITINAGYNYIPKFKELNGWSFGIGFQWVI